MREANPRRLLFVRAPRPAGHTHAYLVIGAIALLAVLGLGWVLWARGEVASNYRPVREGAGATSVGPERGVLIPSGARDLPGRTRRM